MFVWMGSIGLVEKQPPMVKITAEPAEVTTPAMEITRAPVDEPQP